MMLDASLAAKAPGREIPFTHRERVPAQRIMGETIEFPEAAIFSGTFSVRDGSLLMRGVMKVSASGHCARCLAPVTVPISVPFDEALRPRLRKERAEGCVREDEGFSFDGQKADLSHLALTLALLELPIRFLCREDCPGMPGLSLEPQDGGG